MKKRNPMEKFESEIANIIVGRENEATKIESLINMLYQNFILKSEIKRIINKAKPQKATEGELRTMLKTLNEAMVRDKGMVFIIKLDNKK